MMSRMAALRRAGALTFPVLALSFFLPAVGSGSERSLTELLHQLQHPHEAGARLRAAESLAEYGEHAVPALRRLLVHPDELVRSYACVALVRMGPAAVPAVPDLIAIGGNSVESEDLRQVAIFALGQVGPGAASALPMLQAALRETRSPEFRREVICALAAIATPEAVARLIELLEGGDRQDQESVLDGFSAQRHKALPAAAALLAFAARHPDNDLCDWVFITVTACGGEAALELAPYLRSERIGTRRRAALALSRLGPEAVDAVPMLCETLHDDETLVRFWAAKALGNIGPEARHAAAALRQLLDDTDPNVRWEATAALAKIDVAAFRDEDWSRLLTDSDPGVRQQAATIRAMIP